MGGGNIFEIFKVFLRLGLTSFGGPIAHIGYFRREFVVRRNWVDEETFADLVALCQFLPGPASSQVGFALGLSRGGWFGGLAAWCGFTLPSALALFVVASLTTSLNGAAATAAIHGLKLVAIAVVAQAVWGMIRTLTPDFRRAVIAVMAGLGVVLVAGALGQIAVIGFGALAGTALCRDPAVARNGFLKFPLSPRTGAACLATFAGLLLATPLLASALDSHALAVFGAFYWSGALVFGGGHVVLPLLRDAVVTPGWISANAFLAGYGAAQAVPGPLFTVAAYLGAALNGPPNGLVGAALALAGIFLPGMLILAGTLPFWDGFRTRPDAQAAMRGVNAAMVGILAMALYDPLWTSTIASWRDIALAGGGFLLLTMLKVPSVFVVIGITAAAMLLSLAFV